MKPFNLKADPKQSDEEDKRQSDDREKKKQQTPGKNYFDKAPDEIVEMTLINATKSQGMDAFHSISKTCTRFKSVIEGEKEEIIPLVHLNFHENVLQSLPRRGKKITISVKKLSKFFGPSSWVIDCINKAIGKELWRSAWLLIEKRNRIWFIIERVF